MLLPISRPAIAAGVALVLMETLNDIGASEYLGVRTLTLSVFSTWLNRGQPRGRGADRDDHAGHRLRAADGRAMGAAAPALPRCARDADEGAAAARAADRLQGRALRRLLAALPVAAGFGIPLYVFGDYASRRLQQFADPALMRALTNSILTATATAHDHHRHRAGADPCGTAGAFASR